jgi:hypothetical protein
VVRWLHAAALAAVAAAYAAATAAALTFDKAEASWSASSVPLPALRNASADAYAAYLDREWQLRRYAATRTRAHGRARRASDQDLVSHAQATVRRCVCVCVCVRR